MGGGENCPKILCSWDFFRFGVRDESNFLGLSAAEKSFGSLLRVNLSRFARLLVGREISVRHFDRLRSIELDPIRSYPIRSDLIRSDGTKASDINANVNSDAIKRTERPVTRLRLRNASSRSTKRNSKHLRAHLSSSEFASVFSYASVRLLRSSATEPIERGREREFCVHLEPYITHTQEHCVQSHAKSNQSLRAPATRVSSVRVDAKHTRASHRSDAVPSFLFARGCCALCAHAAEPKVKWSH